MTEVRKRTAILLMHCPDQSGLVAAVTNFIAEHGGNIVHLDQHVDGANGVFFMRVEWSLDTFRIPPEEIDVVFGQEIGRPRGMTWLLRFPDQPPRLAIFVSKLPHCLYDILARCQAGEWPVEVPLIVSNHDKLRPIAEQFGVPFHVFPITKQNKLEQEAAELELLRAHDVDLVVLARYMQVVTSKFIEQYPQKIINIHHSFLPAFAGSRPYHAAHGRGVKIIGATSHYVTEELDAGPIIEQDVIRITHRDSIEDLIRKGRELEKLVLARAVWTHLQRKLLCYENRTFIFD